MNGTTNVDQGEVEFQILKFLENEKNRTYLEKQEEYRSIKIREHLEKNGEIDIPVENSKEKEPIKRTKPTRKDEELDK